MEKTLLMAIDLGTSFIKSAVYDTDSNCVAVATAPVKDERPGPGIFIQRGDDLVNAAVECMKKACDSLGGRAQDVEAIAFTGQMSGFMGVDKDWNDVTTWSCSLDARYMPFVERQMKEYKKEFIEISGANCPQMAPKFEWFRTEFPQESKRIAKYLMLSGYILGKLGDVDIEDAVIDRTLTTWSGLVDISKGEWSEELCRAVGMDRKFLPRIVQSNEICGKLKQGIADATGLRSGIALVAGAGDKMAGAIGCNILRPGDMNFEAGSYGANHLCVEDYRPDMEKGLYDCLMAPVGDNYYVTKFITGSGITLDWYMNTFVRRDGEKLGEAFSRVEQEMKDIPVGCNGLMAIGLLSGSGMPVDGVPRGLFMGHDWTHTAAHFYKALLESFTFDMKLTFRRFGEMYPEYTKKAVKVIGGGAKSVTWNQMSADVMGYTYQVLDRDDAATWGAAILAGNAAGVFGDIAKTSAEHVDVVREYAPQDGMWAKYAPHMDLYEDYLKEMRPYYKRIQEINGM